MIDLREFFDDLNSRFEFIPCDSQEDREEMERINAEMEIVKAEFAWKSAESWINCSHQVYLTQV